MKLATLGLHDYDEQMEKFVINRRLYNGYCDSNPGTKLSFREFCRNNKGKQDD